MMGLLCAPLAPQAPSTHSTSFQNMEQWRVCLQLTPVSCHSSSVSLSIPRQTPRHTGSQLPQDGDGTAKQGLAIWDQVLMRTRSKAPRAQAAQSLNQGPPTLSIFLLERNESPCSYQELYTNIYSSFIQVLNNKIFQFSKLKKAQMPLKR